MTVVNQQEDKVSHLRRVRHFSGTGGERIEENTLIDPETLQPLTEPEREVRGIEEPLVLYVGVVSIVNAIMQPTGPIGIPCDARFLIKDATTPAEALANYGEGVQEFERRMQQQQEEYEKQMRQQQQSELVVPNAAESQAINDSMKIHMPD